MGYGTGKKTFAEKLISKDFIVSTVKQTISRQIHNYLAETDFRVANLIWGSLLLSHAGLHSRIRGLTLSFHH